RFRSIPWRANRQRRDARLSRYGRSRARRALCLSRERSRVRPDLRAHPGAWAHVLGRSAQDPPRRDQHARRRPRPVLPGSERSHARDTDPAVRKRRLARAVARPSGSPFLRASAARAWATRRFPGRVAPLACARPRGLCLAVLHALQLEAVGIEKEDGVVVVVVFRRWLDALGAQAAHECFERIDVAPAATVEGVVMKADVADTVLALAARCVRLADPDTRLAVGPADCVVVLVQYLEAEESEQPAVE